MIALYVLAAWAVLAVPAALAAVALERTAAMNHDLEAPPPATDLYEFRHGPRDGELAAEITALDVVAGAAGRYEPNGAQSRPAGGDRVAAVLQWRPASDGRRNPPYCRLAEHPGCPAYGMTGTGT